MPITERPTQLIDDLRALEAINSPTRLRILYQLVEPTTVREIADRLGVPVTRLYYHINALEEVGLIEVVETRKSGARLQRVYRAVAKQFQPGPELLENAEDPERVAEAAAGTVLDGARVDAVAGLTQHIEAISRGEDPPAGAMGRSVVRLNPKDAERFAERLKEFVDEMSEQEDRGGEEYALSFVFFPLGGVKGSG